MAVRLSVFQVCFPMIDRLLEQQCIVTFGDLVNAVDTIAAPENAVLQVIDISGKS